MSARAALSIGIAIALSLVALQAQQAQTYGDGVSLKETTALAQVIATPARFEGKTVRVEGTVTAVCMHMGCWMALTPDAGSNAKTMLIKVDDGVIVFPSSVKGKRAAAQGVIERIGAGTEGQEAASEQARSTGASAPVSWQLKATGALVYQP